MYFQTSQRYKNIIYNPSIQSVVNIYVDGVLLNPKYLTDFKSGCELFDGELELGSVPSQYIEMQIHKNSGITNPKTIKIEYGILVNNALTVAEVNSMLVKDFNNLMVRSLAKEDNSFEMIPIGIYNVDDYNDEDDNVINIKALDNIIKLDKDDGYYDASTLINKKGYATLGEIAQDICNKKGLELETSSFLNADKKVSVYDNQLKAREYMSYIAECADCFCCANRAGKIVFRKIGQDEVEIPLKLFKTYKFGEKYKISRVAFEDGVRSFKFGDETRNTLWIRQENLFVIDENEIENIYNEIKDLTINSFEGTVIIDPSIDIGDKIKIGDKYIIYQGEMTLNKRFIADIKSKINIKQKEETTVKKESQKVINRRVQSEINQTDGKVTQLVEEQTETFNKLSLHEQTIDGMKDAIKSQETKIETVESKADDTQKDINNLKIQTIVDVDVEYALGTNTTTAPTTGWNTKAPTWENGKYMWQRTVTTYGNGTKETSNATCIAGAKGDKGETGATGTNGEDGDDGIGVKAIEEQYYLSTSSATQTGGNWKTTQDTWTNGKYIWTRNKITWTDNTTTYTTPTLATGLNNANNVASNANTTANTAKSTADTAKSTADTANTNANEAKKIANENTTKITTNTTKIAEVEKTVDGITQSVSAVEEKIETVETKANNAQSTASTATTKAETAQNTANTAKSVADVAKSTADSVNTNLTTKYYTKTETENKITQTAESTISEVSKTYSTKTETATAKTEAINSANSSTDNKLKDYTVTTKLGTFIEQNWEHIKYAWNQISQYLQMEGINGKATLNIYNENNNMLMSLSQDGQAFYDTSGNKIGTIGVIREDNKDILAFAMPVDWEHVDTSKSMAWGVHDPNGQFLPIFYLAGYYGAGNSEYGGMLEIVGNLTADQLKVINGVEFNSGGLVWVDDKYYILPVPNFDGSALREWLTYKAPHGHEFFCGDNSVFSMDSELIYPKKPFFISYSGNNGHIGYPMIGINQNNKYYCYWDGGDLYFYADGTYAGNISDKRLKTDFKEIDNKFLDAISELEIKQFKADNRNEQISFGIIAQDLIKVFKKYNINPNDYEILQKIQYNLNDDTKYYTIEYTQFLVLKQLATDKKLQELQKKDRQKEEILQNLLKRIETLEEGEKI